MLIPALFCSGFVLRLTVAAPVTGRSAQAISDSPDTFQCPGYDAFAGQRHAPYSSGVHKLSYQRPEPRCRTFNSSVVEQTIQQYKSIIKDPDLFQLFQNTFPNTLDTTIKWRGYSADDPTEELAFVITGDIDAMWLRDSTNQLHAYASLIKPSSDSDQDSLASLFRGAINLQARYISNQPWCNAFQAPPESGIRTSYNGGAYTFTPDIDMKYCFTPNFELDSFGSFFELSYDYFYATRDAAFFEKYQWVKAVRQILRIARSQMEPFFNASGDALTPAYTFNSQTTYMGGSLDVDGLGTPVKYTGMVKAPFRPSDNSVLFQFLVPSNIMFAGYLNRGAEIMRQLGTTIDDAKSLAKEMQEMASTIEEAVEKFAIVSHPTKPSEKIFSFEVDGYGGRNLMDDANTPSLLSMPMHHPAHANKDIHRSTREWVLSLDNPWWAEGSVISGVGSSHTGIGKPWPMALITRIQTSGELTCRLLSFSNANASLEDDDEEIIDQLRQLLNSTDGLGLMHESIDANNASRWTRQWWVEEPV